jgi:RNA polymerase sigma-70 factor (ECF subfamily)
MRSVPKPGGATVIPIVQDDATLVAALLAGHERAPAMLFDRYGALVQRVLVRTIGFHHPDKADLLHDVFVRALERIGTLKNPQSLKHWLIGITVFTAQESIRRRKRIGPTENPEKGEQREAYGATPESIEAVRALYAIVDRLGRDERAAFILRFIEGMTLDEVAEASTVSLSTARRRISRAEARFRELLPDYPSLIERLREKE